MFGFLGDAIAVLWLLHFIRTNHLTLKISSNHPVFLLKEKRQIQRIGRQRDDNSQLRRLWHYGFICASPTQNDKLIDKIMQFLPSKEQRLHIAYAEEKFFMQTRTQTFIHSLRFFIVSKPESKSSNNLFLVTGNH